MTLLYTSSSKIKAEHPVAPVLDNMRLQIDFQLLHAPNELNSGITQRVKFAEKYTCFWELGKDVILQHDGAGKWIEVWVTDFLVVK